MWPLYCLLVDLLLCRFFAKFAQVRLEIEEIELGKLGNCYLILLRIYIYYDGRSILVAISGSTLYCYYWYMWIILYIIYHRNYYRKYWFWPHCYIFDTVTYTLLIVDIGYLLYVACTILDPQLTVYICGHSIILPLKFDWSCCLLVYCYIFDTVTFQWGWPSVVTWDVLMSGIEPRHPAMSGSIYTVSVWAGTYMFNFVHIYILSVVIIHWPHIYEHSLATTFNNVN